jgi:IclR helix-turn-helix domain
VLAEASGEAKGSVRFGKPAQDRRRTRFRKEIHASVLVRKHDVCQNRHVSNSTGIVAIPPNPGGSLPPPQILGRDSLVERCWHHLEQQSIALFSPRRVGKTSVLRLLAHRARPGWHVRFHDLERLDSAQAFAQLLYFDALDLLSGRNKALARAKAFLQRVSGSIELSNVKLTLAGDDWRRFLDDLFDDLEEELGRKDERLVFLWDELTLFIGDMTLRGHARDAMVLLDTLRAVRQRCSRIRMVLTGSIGFHLIKRQLDEEGYRNQPINDVRIESVPMLEPDDARPLVEALLRGIGVEPQTAVTESIIAHSEGHPFLIQHLVESLRGKHEPSERHVAVSLAKLLSPPSVLDLGHHASRLAKYYGEREAPALAILDALAKAPKGMTLGALLKQLAMDRTIAVPVVQALRDDDYLVQRGRHLRFALDFVRRYWCEDRML